MGLNVFIINAQARDVPMRETFKGVVPFLASEAVRVTLLVAFPAISLSPPAAAAVGGAMADTPGPEFDALTAGGALLARLKALGVDYVFANSGTDFPPIIEGLAEAAAKGIAAAAGAGHAARERRRWAWRTATSSPPAAARR